MKAPRIHGVDLGYGLLLIIIVALGTACSQSNVLFSDVKGEFNLFYDSAVAAFLFLNASLLSQKLASAPAKNIAFAVRKQSAVIILAGLIQFIFDPCSFLLLLGLCMFIGSYLANLSTSIVSFCLVSSMFISLYLFRNPLNPPSAGYIGAATGVVQNILFDGYFSLFPWLVFYCSGIVFSRLHFSQVRPLSVLFGCSMIALSYLVHNKLNIELMNSTELVYLFPEASLLLPAFLPFALGIAVLFWSAFVLSTQTPWARFLSILGSMRYSILIFTTILALLMHLVLHPRSTGMMLLFNLIIWAIVIPLVWIWRKQYNLGPVERWFRSIFKS